MPLPDAYFSSLGEHRADRKLYQQARITLTVPVTHAQVSDEIAQKVLTLRLPGVMFLLPHVGDRETTLTLLDAGTGKVAAVASTPMGEAEWRAGHAAYHRELQEMHGVPDPAAAMGRALDTLLRFYADALGPPLEAFLPFLRERHLKIFPRLFMNEFPFHALTVGGRPLIEHCENVSYAHTLGLFLQVHRLGNAPEDAPAARTVAALHDAAGTPFYAGTLASLAAVYGDSLRVSSDPSWAEARAAFGEQRPTDILFACHAAYDPDAPADSHLTLGRSEAVSFTKVFADLDLAGCDSVTLGACESGLGRTIVTAEFLGLPTAFFAAGARHVIGSLWKMHQVAAAILLDRHFRLLKEGGQTVPDALNEAQRALRRMTQEQVIAWLQANLPVWAEVLEPFIRSLGEPPFAHPYYWAGFYAAGDV